MSEGINKITLPESKDLVEYVIVHQKYHNISINNNSLMSRNDVTIINDDGIGLTRSRNIAIEHARFDYCYVLDDDVTILNEAIDILLSIQDDLDLMTFRVATPEGSMFKPYALKEKKIDIISAARICSIEIMFKKSSIESYNIKFDERFGLGTKLPSGEEYIFISECLKKGLKCKYFPITTVIHEYESSGDDFFSSLEKIKAKKEMFKVITGKKYSFLWFAFLIKKIPVLIKKKSLSKFIANYI